MPLPEWSQWLTVAGLSGMTGAAITGWFARSGLKITGKQQAARQQQELDSMRRRQILDLDGQLQRQNNDHEHQRAMLGQEAHFDVRREMAELASNVHFWLSYELLDKHGPDVDMFPANVPPRPYQEPRFAIGDLDKIAVAHPTKTVREVAGNLSLEIGGVYNSIASSGNGMQEPDLNHMLTWSAELRKLIESINEPPSESRPLASPISGRASTTDQPPRD